MNFYFNDQIDVCAEEPWVVEYLIENGFCENEDEALHGLHSCRNFYGWFDCEVSATIEAFFKKMLDKLHFVCYNKYVIKRAVALRNGDNRNEKCETV